MNGWCFYPLDDVGTNISFPKPEKSPHAVSVAIFPGVVRLNDHFKLSFFSGLLIGPLALDSKLHTISWMSHKSKRLVRSIAESDILAASEAIDEAKYAKIRSLY